MMQQGHAPVASDNKRDKVSEEEWNRACQFRTIVQRWLDTKQKTRAQAEAHAEELHVSPATFYRLVQRYIKQPKTSCFLRSSKKITPRTGRLTEDQEALMTSTINKHYLNKRRPTQASAYNELRVDCHLKKIPLPSMSAFRERILSVAPKTVCSKRFSIKHANEKYKREQGHFPYAEYPLQCIQIDHTPTDRHLVDPTHRSIIGRAFLTTAIDCYSRACLGYYLSFAHPSTLSVAMCLAHAVLRKDKWLLERRISTPWPMHGLPDIIHTDNAKEFRRNLFVRDCQEYGISALFRPLGQPNFGGTVESWIRNMNRQNHGQPGSTSSPPNRNSDYNPEKDACLTLSELDRRWALFITGVYHNKVHSEIGMPPMAKFEQGLQTMYEKYGKTIREPEDPDRFLLDFLPQVTRTVQKYGVRFNHIEYDGEILDYLLNMSEKRSYTVRYDPRDISKLFIYVPSEQKYYPLVYRDKSLPPMSQYEYNIIVREAQRAGKALENEAQIVESLLEMRRDTEKALKETKHHKRKRRQKALQPGNNPSTVPVIKNGETTKKADSNKIGTAQRADRDEGRRSEGRKPVYEFDPKILQTGIDLE
jgi:putative transposase